MQTIPKYIVRLDGFGNASAVVASAKETSSPRVAADG